MSDLQSSDVKQSLAPKIQKLMDYLSNGNANRIEARNQLKFIQRKIMAYDIEYKIEECPFYSEKEADKHNIALLERIYIGSFIHCPFCGNFVDLY